MDRRTFLKTTAASGAVLTVGAGAAGCGNDVEPAPLASVTVLTSASQASALPAATLDDVPGTVGYGTVQLQVPFYPDLAKVGGALTLEMKLAESQDRGYAVPPDGTILVVQYAAGQFAAVQSSCPHAGCPLGYSVKDALVECPCHASRFRVVADPANSMSCAGDVVHLPARAPLTTWNVDYNTAQQLLTIDLNSARPCNNTFPPVVNATLTLPLADFPQLTMPGGAVTGQPMGAPDPIVVVRVDAATVVALDAKCTHRGCTVAWASERSELECPCHGSAFGTDGRVLSPPATTPLKSYQATLSANAIVINVV